jgi:Putative S-adenosyl-L-methionine-dependent methyltransferase
MIPHPTWPLTVASNASPHEKIKNEMVSYTLSPYAHFIESRLIPGASQHAVFHQLTGEVCLLRERVRTLLLAAKVGVRVSLIDEDLIRLADGAQIRELIEKEFLVPDGFDPLTSFPNHYVVRPIQNPALVYRAETGELLLARTSMQSFAFSPDRNEFPEIIEERMPPEVGEIFLLADGSRSLQQIFESVRAGRKTSLLKDVPFREAINFLTKPERQLIKLAARVKDADDPLSPCNLAPRTLYHAEKRLASLGGEKPHVSFHLGIHDALWEFDQIEPTLNHAFRFPSEVLGGFDYGSRFCRSLLRPELLSSLGHSRKLSILEVGGGTGTFAVSFIEQLSHLKTSRFKDVSVCYSILELSPALAEHQKKLLAERGLTVCHFQQDATQFDLNGRKFDLIIANEVVADFPVARVWRKADRPHETKTGSIARRTWEGEGASYADKYSLDLTDAPAAFVLNAGAFEFLERAWDHLLPGGVIMLTEYGSEHAYPIQAYNLNHEEYSIHFGHVKS